MNIGPYISELLYDFECVVLPGFGGFIVNDKRASINMITHQFKPPYRQIIFNVHLSANDGLLINHIAAAEDLSYEVVKSRISLLVEDYHQLLQKGSKVTIGKIGVLTLDANKHIVFDQDHSVNYNPYSFGLAIFTSPAIARKTDEEKLKGIIVGREKPKVKRADRKPIPVKKQRSAREKRSSAVPVFAMVVFLLLLAVGWGITNTNKVTGFWETTTATVPFLNSSNENALNEATYVPRISAPYTFEKENDNIELLKAETNEKSDSEASSKTKEVITETTVVKEKLVVTEPRSGMDNKAGKPDINPTGKQYYIIAGSFSDLNNANRLIESLDQKGFQAQIADTNTSGMYRVAYKSYQTLAMAKQSLSAIRQENNPDAWILRK